jgi:hypothetical protein
MAVGSRWRGKSIGSTFRSECSGPNRSTEPWATVTKRRVDRRLFRKFSARPGNRVLFTSGYTENAIVHHGRLDPGVALLNKPYRKKDLAEKIRAVLDGQASAWIWHGRRKRCVAAYSSGGWPMDVRSTSNGGGKPTSPGVAEGPIALVGRNLGHVGFTYDTGRVAAAQRSDAMGHLRTHACSKTTCGGWLTRSDNGPAKTPRSTLSVEGLRGRQKRI